jgi:hypothetical protein
MTMLDLARLAEFDAGLTGLSHRFPGLTRDLPLHQGAPDQVRGGVCPASVGQAK